MTRQITISCLLAGALLTAPPGIRGQSEPRNSSQPEVDKAEAYYNYAMGHLYSELAGAYGNKGDFVDKAIDSYRKAMEADPDATFLSEELSDLYIQAGRLREAVLDAETALRKDPSDVSARRILARIYTRLIGDSRRNQINEEMVTKATEQYEKIVELEPDNIQDWLMLGRLHKLGQDSLKAEDAYKKVLEIDEENQDALVGLATVYSDLGDQPRAAEMLRKVIGKNPDLRTLSFLAQTYERMGDNALAAETYRQALEIAPRNAEIKRAYAHNLKDSGKTDEALTLFEQLAEDDPKDFDALLRVSQILRQKGQLKRAREALDKAKEISPGNLEILYSDVNLLEAEGKADDAIAALQDILESTQRISYSKGERTNRAIFLERLGLMYRGANRIEDAIKIFRELQELDPDKASRVSAQIADTYRQGRDFEKAFEVIDAAHSEHPDDEMVATVRASILADLGRADEAIKAVREITKGDKSREDHLTEAQIYEKTKRFDLMAEALEAALSLSKTDAEKTDVLFMRGAMFERQKRFDEAEESFREVLKLSPDNASAMNYMGYMFADRGVKLETALELITKALEYDPNNGAFLDSLGWVYYRLERFAEAEEYLQRAAELVGNDPIIYDHLADVYLQRGKLREAINYWNRSLQEWERSPAGEKDPSQVAKIKKKLDGAEVQLALEGTQSQEKQP